MRGIVEKYGTAIAGLILFVFFLLFARNFANAGNLLNILKQTSFLVILAVGFSFALITSELDLSFRQYRLGGGHRLWRTDPQRRTLSPCHTCSVDYWGFAAAC